MSSSRDTIVGEVVELLPNSEVRVDLGDNYQPAGHIVRCYMSGKMRLNRIRILIGDKVQIVLPYQSSVGRVVRRV